MNEHQDEIHIGLIAGEKSGDLLGAALMEELQREFAGKVRFSGVGGSEMQAQGLQVIADNSRLAVMGLFEVLRHLPAILRLKKELLNFWKNDKPQLFIGIDAPDFNLRIAKIMKKRGVQTVHYVSPSLWAWKEYRIKGIKKAIDLMLCLFAFETSIYKRHDMRVVCVGHPLRDRLQPQEISSARQKIELNSQQVLGIFPGSRSGEIQRLLPVFLETYKILSEQNEHLTALVSVSERRNLKLIQDILAEQHTNIKGIMISEQPSQMLISASDVVLLASGTITLEAALLQRAMVVAYRVNPMTAFIARRLLRIPHCSLPNLLSGQKVVAEFIQEDCRAKLLAQELHNLLNNEQQRRMQLTFFNNIVASLPLNVSQKAAAAIGQLLRQ